MQENTWSLMKLASAFSLPPICRWPEQVPWARPKPRAEEAHQTSARMMAGRARQGTLPLPGATASSHLLSLLSQTLFFPEF